MINFFYLGLTFIFIHELDAIRCREWRIFPILSSLDEKLAERIFYFAHIPLFYFCFVELAVHQNTALQYGLSWFFIIHLGLHLLFLMHPKNEFKDWLSWTWIIGAAVFGALDLLII